MTLAEFKAWFEGFTEDMDGAPNEKQWKRIKAKIKDINGASVTPVVIKEYYDRYRRWWPDGVWYGADKPEPLRAYYTSGTVDHGNGLRSQSSPGNADIFMSTAAVHDLGKAEYKAMLS